MDVSYSVNPWLAHHDDGVPHKIEPEDRLLHEFLCESASRFPNQTAIIFRGVRISYRALDELSDAIASALNANGVRK